MACMPITRAEVAHLASLSRLALTDSELDKFAGQLDEILAAVARVQEVAGTGQQPAAAGSSRVNVFRDDVIVPPLGASLVLSQAPAAEQDRFRVPRILAQD
jgi:aspartyl-tRNA(Asn)/glutamyl-tRNA(Gln) amidotransferase subunit C